MKGNAKANKSQLDNNVEDVETIQFKDDAENACKRPSNNDTADNS